MTGRSVVLLLFSLSLFGQGSTYVSVSPDAYTMAYSPDKTKLYVAGASGNLDVVNLGTRTVITIPVSNLYTQQICVNDIWGIVMPSRPATGGIPSYGKVFVVNPQTFSIQQSQLTILADGCAFSRDGQLLYLSGWPANIVNVVSRDLSVREIQIPQNSISNSMRYIVRIPQEDKFYLPISGFQYSQEEKIGVLKSDGSVKILPLPPVNRYLHSKVFFNPDGNGRTAYATYWLDPDPGGYASGLLTIDTTGDELVGFLPLPRLGQIAYMRFVDEKLAYVLTDLDNIAVLNLQKNTFTSLSALAPGGNRGLEVIPGTGGTDTLAVLGPGKVTFLNVKRPTLAQPPAITNSATLLIRDTVRGELATIFGAGNELSDTPMPQSANGFPLPVWLGGTQVLINGIPAPLLYVSSNQINLQVPFELTGNSATIEVVPSPGKSRITIHVTVADADVGIFSSVIGNGVLRPIVVNVSRGGFVTPSVPAFEEEWISLYVTGLGEVVPMVASGQPAPVSPLALTKTPVTVTINGQPVEVGYSGLAPWFAGLYQVNIIVPAGLTPGPQILKIALSSSSQDIVLFTGRP